MEKLTKADLVVLARKQGIKNATKYRKADLLEILNPKKPTQILDRAEFIDDKKLVKKQMGDNRYNQVRAKQPLIAEDLRAIPELNKTRKQLMQLIQRYKLRVLNTNTGQEIPAEGVIGFYDDSFVVYY